MRGTHRAAMLGWILITCACGSPERSSPVSPDAPHVPDAPQVAVKTASYFGHYRMTSCQGCAVWEGQFWSFTLIITRSDDAYSARMHLDPWALDANLTGTRRSDGTLLLAGSAGPVSGMVLGAEFRDVIVREDPALGLTGSFAYNTLGPNGPGGAITAEIRSASVGSPSPVPQNVAGTWSGHGRHSGTCQADLGCGDPTFGLIVVDEGGSYVAFWDYKSETGRIAIVLNGVATGNGSILFQGATPGPAGISGWAVTVRRLAIMVDSSGVMTGDYDYAQDHGPATTSATGVLFGGSRRERDFSPGPFDGDWEGDFVQRTCTGDCPFFYVGMGGLPLTLTQAGSSVQGQPGRQPLALSGTASGTSVVLEGASENPNCVAKHSGPCTEKFRITVTSVDRWGRMSGTVQHTYNGPYELSTYAGEIWNVARQVPAR
jgi:hypothetical protein